MRKIVLCMASALLLFALTACGPAAQTSSDSASQPESESAVSGESAVQSEKDAAESAEASAAPDEPEANQAIEGEETMQISVKSSEHEIVYELNDSQAARELYAQLPLSMEVEPYSNNEMTFYPPEKLVVEDAPLSGGAVGSLSYYAPWGDVVMFYAPCSPNGSLYELGTAVSGADNISKLSGTITISAK